MSRMRGFLLVLVGAQMAAAADPPSLDEHLEPLRPLLGKTWTGTFPGGTSETPIVDVMRWERALNGKAVRVLHSINAGAYGGEMMIRWDAEQDTLTFHYFTTADFMTVGTMKLEDGKIMTEEVVKGNPGGVREIRGTSELLPDGKLRVRTERLVDGQWNPGRDVIYEATPDAKVEFR